MSGFQSPYTPPTQVQRAPPAPIFATPQRDHGSAQNTPASQKQTPTPVVQDGAKKSPETPKVGGRWTHPALQGIQKEARKFMFGEEELKRLVANAFLLYSMWWLSYKFEDRYGTALWIWLTAKWLSRGYRTICKTFPKDCGGSSNYHMEFTRIVCL